MFGARVPVAQQTKENVGDTNIKRKEQMCLVTEKVSVCTERPRCLCETCTSSVSSEHSPNQHTAD